MKKLSIRLTILYLFLTNAMHAQVVDSVVVKLRMESPDSITWTYNLQDIDSFSTGTLKSNLWRTWLNNSWENEWWWAYTYSPVSDTTTMYQWAGQWNNYYRYIKFYNALGLDTVEYWQMWYSGSWRNADRFERTYNADSSIATEINSTWNSGSSQWEYYQFSTWNRDSTGRDTAITTDLYNNGNWDRWKRESITYDSAGNKIANIGNYYDDTDSTYWLTYHQDSWMYDSLGRMIYSSSGDVPGGHGYEYYFYNPDNSYSDTWSHYSSSNDETWYHTHYYNSLSNNVYAFLPDDYFICNSDSMPIGGFVFGGQQPLHFSWTPATGLSSDTIENPYVFIDTTTTFIFTVTDTNNITASDTITITVPHVVDSLITTPASCPMCYDGQILIATSLSSVHNVTITPDPGVTIQGVQITNVPPGIYTVCMETQSGCVTCETDTVGFTVGIKEIQSTEFYITTNPFSDYTELHCKSVSENLRMEIYDELGAKVDEIKISSSVTRINRDNLVNGIYYGVISEDGVSERLKLILVK